MRLNRVMFAAVVGAALSSGCVADRPARNSVFNENTYVRKDFLIKAGAAAAEDPGYTWRFQAMVTDVSSPNPLAGLSVQPGTNNSSDSSYTTAGTAFVRFAASQDTLSLLDVREIADAPATGRTPEVVNAWPVTHVDLKYRIDLDGEKTNEYIENQELDWRMRQWIKVNFAKNDMADLVPLGSALNAQVARCTQLGNAAATMIPSSFKVDEPKGYMEWGIEVTVPLNYQDEACALLFGENGVSAQRLGRDNVTVHLKYSFARTDLNSPPTGYVPLALDEKDPIRHKYGVFTQPSTARDPNTGLLGAQEYAVRWNPARTEPVVWYFDKGFPQEYKDIFLGAGGIKEETNQLLGESGAALTFDFQDAPDGVTFGDARYSWLYWMSDKDSAGNFAGLTELALDPNTGETHTANIIINDFEIKETYVQRINAFLKTVGAIEDVNSTDWKSVPDGASGACQDGQSLPLVTANVRETFNAASTLFTKMSSLLTPATGVTPLNAGPYDFVPPADPGFLEAYYAALPYTVFREPGANVFVTPEGGGGTHTEAEIWAMTQREVDFRKMAAGIDQGIAPFDDTNGAAAVASAKAYVSSFHDLAQNHQSLRTSLATQGRARTSDAPTAFSFDSIMSRSARHCMGGQWETKDQWQQRLITTYWRAVFWHEFGHALGLRHNFMGSIDWKNFPMVTVPGPDGQPVTRPAVASSSVMEYNSTPDRVFWEGGWGPYDQGALSFVYANGVKDGDADPKALSGQKSATQPWKDPRGFSADGSAEIKYLFCTDEHTDLSPFCKRGDLGTRPSEIVANAIEGYEWQYNWRNFRMGRKIWNLSAYPDFATNFVTDLRAFMPIAMYDWSYTTLATQLRVYGVQPPAGTPALLFYQQMSGLFTRELSVANQLAAAFHFAIVQQGSGERPYKTLYDKYNGDVTQQGIILDKVFAIQSFSDLWYMENYDRNKEGTYLGAFGSFFQDGLDGKDGQYNALSDRVIASMLGGQYDVYSFQQVASVAAFAGATQRVEFLSAGRPEVKDWIGSVTFIRDVDFLENFRSMAALYEPDQTACPGGKYCDYDPRLPRGFPSDVQLSDEYHEFVGPNGRRYIWMYIENRHMWVVCDRDRNVATYQAVRNWTELVIRGEDDGTPNGSTTTAFTLEKQVKSMVDFYAQYN